MALFEYCSTKDPCRFRPTRLGGYSVVTLISIDTFVEMLTASLVPFLHRIPIVQLKKPLFLHERAAFGTFSEVRESPYYYNTQ